LLRHSGIATSGWRFGPHTPLREAAGRCHRQLMANIFEPAESVTVEMLCIF
jgi:hypothetical protein